MAVASAERCNGTLCPCCDDPRVTIQEVAGSIGQIMICNNLSIYNFPFVKVALIKGKGHHILFALLTLISSKAPELCFVKGVVLLSGVLIHT